ncbi:DUF6902 family protein [Phaeobacter sp. C3_T13_0]|uniref:DUF6902 family protein n=1 Tax=Phaeobacter cretensis TaxID=3342641 RepID=UPI0039BD02F0
MTIILPFTNTRSGNNSPTESGGNLSVAAGTAAAWIESFARYRRQPDDVFWLKENAELLSLLRVAGQRDAGECAGGATGVGDSGGEVALAPLRPFYDGAARQLQFFPQYYRFILSICLDYEDLTGTSGSATALAHWVATQGLVEGELSDLQRAEVQQLLARRGIVQPIDPGLVDRLRCFARRSRTFAIPNRKAAYELTHIVFYLSDYGRRDPGLDDQARRSLIYAGILACLDQDLDLLSEICIALRYCGAAPPPDWEHMLSSAHGQFILTPDGFDGRMDGYHTYFVTLWWQVVHRQAEASVTDLLHTNLPTAGLPAAAGRALHIAAPGAVSLLRPVSTWLMAAGDSPHLTAPMLWRQAVDHVAEHYGQNMRRQLIRLQNSTAEFADFWRIFSRPGQASVQLSHIGAGGLGLMRGDQSMLRQKPSG